MARKTFLCNLGIFTAIVLCPLIPQALAAPRQEQSNVSVAEAARKARAAKKPTAPGAKVYTNDDVVNLKGPISVVGPAPAAPAKPADDKSASATPGTTAGTPAAPATTDKAPAPTARDEASWRKAFADARKKLADDSKELDILQREFNLKQQQFYTDPNAALREQNTRQDLNDTQAQIDMKKMQVDQDNQALADLGDQLRTSGGDPGWAREQ